VGVPIRHLVRVAGERFCGSAMSGAPDARPRYLSLPEDELEGRSSELRAKYAKCDFVRTTRSRPGGRAGRGVQG